ncbi:unnamed protein product [Somion occarium]|uniref:Uncharacterized protein n=1 Tax=Somion occarium TaxID=3059160 RepID=A0ABP1DNA9_9APHY
MCLYVDRMYRYTECGHEILLPYCIGVHLCKPEADRLTHNESHGPDAQIPPSKDSAVHSRRRVEVKTLGGLCAMCQYCLVEMHNFAHNEAPFPGARSFPLPWMQSYHGIMPAAYPPPPGHNHTPPSQDVQALHPDHFPRQQGFDVNNLHKQMLEEHAQHEEQLGRRQVQQEIVPSQVQVPPMASLKPPQFAQARRMGPAYSAAHVRAPQGYQDQGLNVEPQWQSSTGREAQEFTDNDEHPTQPLSWVRSRRTHGYVHYGNGDSARSQGSSREASTWSSESDYYTED